MDNPKQDMGAKQDMGEGSYAGSRDYMERTKLFIGKKGDEVTDLAHEAEAALDGAEGDDLRAAEAKGRDHARH